MACRKPRIFTSSVADIWDAREPPHKSYHAAYVYTGVEDVARAVNFSFSMVWYSGFFVWFRMWSKNHLPQSRNDCILVSAAEYTRVVRSPGGPTVAATRRNYSDREVYCRRWPWNTACHAKLFSPPDHRKDYYSFCGFTAISPLPCASQV